MAKEGDEVQLPFPFIKEKKHKKYTEYFPLIRNKLNHYTSVTYVIMFTKHNKEVSGKKKRRRKDTMPDLGYIDRTCYNTQTR